MHLAAGYNRTRIVQLLLTHGADVHAKDKGGLVPLHNACSYGHFEVMTMSKITKMAKKTRMCQKIKLQNYYKQNDNDNRKTT